MICDSHIVDDCTAGVSDIDFRDTVDIANVLKEAESIAF
jgi:hypothetical protein